MTSALDRAIAAKAAPREHAVAADLVPLLDGLVLALGREPDPLRLRAGLDAAAALIAPCREGAPGAAPSPWRARLHQPGAGAGAVLVLDGPEEVSIWLHLDPGGALFAGVIRRDVGDRAFTIEDLGGELAVRLSDEYGDANLRLGAEALRLGTTLSTRWNDGAQSIERFVGGLARLVCPGCGLELPDDARFCGACGMKISS
jgi:hypothetical protein